MLFKRKLFSKDVDKALEEVEHFISGYTITRILV